MFLRGEAHTRPSTSDLVLALNYLTSHPYDPNKVHGNRGRRIRHRDLQVNECHVDFNGSENSPNETPTSNKELELERAVAEAKMWGETWREKKRQNAEMDYDNLDR